MEIRAFITDDPELPCYVEGVHPNVDILDATPGAGGFFMFEEPFVEACMILQRIGFTATQILESMEVADDGDDRPWGEQQGQVDWLESRFDMPGEMMGDDFDG